MKRLFTILWKLFKNNFFIFIFIIQWQYLSNNFYKGIIIKKLFESYDMKKLEDLILTYKDFPKKGIYFKDVLEILQNPDIFQDLIFKMSSNKFLENAEAIIPKNVNAMAFYF